MAEKDKELEALGGAPLARVPLTETELDSLEKLLSVATAGPWTTSRDEDKPIPGVVEVHDNGACGDPECCGDYREYVHFRDEDAELCASLRNLAPALIEEIRAARAWRKEAEALLHKTVMADHCHGHICRKHDRCEASKVEEEVWNFLGDREGNAPQAPS